MKKHLSLFLILSVTALTVLSLTTCGKNKNNLQISQSGFFFDTVITITLYNTDDNRLIQDSFALAKEYEDLLSNTIESSDISNINLHPGEFVEVDPRTAEVLTKAVEYSRLSNGAFDITIGKLTELWNISGISLHSESNNHIVTRDKLPSPEMVASLLPHVDYHNITIQDNRVMLNDKDSKLDLGAIAKGYIADRMRQFLNQHNVYQGIINLGGNLLTLGPKTENADYRIGIQYPFKDSGDAICGIRIQDGSIVTSGIYERYFKVGDTLYHHVLDTETGYPVDNDLDSVTIVSSSSCDGDALSTICLALGYERASALIESLDGIDALFIFHDHSIQYTSGLEGRVINIKQ